VKSLLQYTCKLHGWSSPGSLQFEAERRPWPGRFHQHTFPSLPSLECTCCTSSWDQARRAYWPQSVSSRVYLFRDTKFLPREESSTSRSLESIQLYWSASTVCYHMYSSGCLANLDRGGLILAEFNLVIFPQMPNRQIKNLTKFSHYMVCHLSMRLTVANLDSRDPTLYVHYSSLLLSRHNPEFLNIVSPDPFLVRGWGVGTRMLQFS